MAQVVAINRSEGLVYSCRCLLARRGSPQCRLDAPEPNVIGRQAVRKREQDRPPEIGLGGPDFFAEHLRPLRLHPESSGHGNEPGHAQRHVDFVRLARVAKHALTGVHA